TLSISSGAAFGVRMRRRADGTAANAACAPRRASWIEPKIPTVACMRPQGARTVPRTLGGMTPVTSGRWMHAIAAGLQLTTASRPCVARGHRSPTAPLRHLCDRPRRTKEATGDEQGNPQGTVEAAEGPRPQTVG